MKFRTGMSEKERNTICKKLAIILADTYVLYLKTQNFHWNYTGLEFYPFHLLFQKQYEELAEAIDEIAERMRALGVAVEASFDGFKKLATITEKKGLASSRNMIEQLIEGHEIVIVQWRKLTDIAEKNHDGATVDLAGRRLNIHEKFLWMLQSNIPKL